MRSYFLFKLRFYNAGQNSKKQKVKLKLLTKMTNIK